MRWILGILCMVALTLISAYVCFRLAFSVPKRKGSDMRQFLQKGEQYDPYRKRTLEMMEAAAKLPYEDVWIDAEDGLKLHGRYYHTADGAPVQIMFHGYRSCPELDFGGGLPYALESGCNVLLVDQRAHGLSAGKCLTMGVLERYDCLGWMRYVVDRFGADTRIVLYGMSMGAATVLFAAGLALPKNVRGIVADCGYSSPSAIIRKVLRDRRYPVWLVYPLIRLGGRVFGGFDVESTSAVESMPRCAIPVLCIHGTDDRFVPYEMGQENYRLCASANKRLLLVPHAGHGLSYMVDKPEYIRVLREFLTSIGV